VDLVAEAQNNQASGERVSKWFGEKYTWFVLIASLAVFLFRLFVLKLPPREASYQSLTLLVALSPCALVISVPAATLSAMTWAARHGLLIRGGEMIERMGQVTAFTFDKTGTLTEGRPELTEICLCDVECNGSEICWGGNGEFSAEAAEILAYAASAEAQSEHPVGHAVRRSVPAGTSIPVAETIEVIPGEGIRAMIDGKRVLIGQLSLIEQSGLKPTDDFREHFAEIQARGWTVAALAVDGKMAALGFKDGLKKGAVETLEKLRQQGITSMTMLTGDHPRTAEAIAKEVGLKDFHAALMPGDKLAIIDKLSKDHKVAMVGDGINDAPALTQAYVGIAMGGLGSDIALNAADIVLMNDRIEALPELIALGRRTNRIVLANLIVGGGVIASLTVTSLAGLLPLPIAVVGHEGSTLLVILNGLRLLRGPFAKI
jgi:Cd2+/Zn2+-exporting ATPase